MALSLLERVRQLGLKAEAQLEQCDPQLGTWDKEEAFWREVAADARLSGQCPGNCLDCPVEHPEACPF